ncbi:hypothetical protein ACEN8K_27725 [Variovorax sp. CT11-76]
MATDQLDQISATARPQNTPMTSDRRAAGAPASSTTPIFMTIPGA